METTTSGRKQHGRVYKWFVDGIANNLFSLVYGLPEYFIGGNTLRQVAGIRATAAIGNMATGRPYSWWQETLNRWLGITESSHGAKKYGADVLAFATGQSPLYVGYLLGPTVGLEAVKAIYNIDTEGLKEAWNNVDWGKIGAGTAFLTMIAPAAATPQRWVYDRVRKAFGLEALIAKDKI